ncbi:MAG TPA: OsmC family protein [Chlamydiales bacterium]|nr:OsmC family protein [Chlamydiales bacterium]
MVKFPMKFEAQANATSGITSLWTAQTDLLPPIPCAIPPEFMGPGGGYSPEDLFSLAIVNCVIATFKVYCERGKVSFQNIFGKAVLTVDRLHGESGIGMTQIDITFDVQGASDGEKVKKTLESAIQDCAVSNSIKTGKTFHINLI